ncbi:4'-phosphopantetheinyl transferase superfamily protein [Shimwellia pseudoproteus]|uniref:4'-phosphopantetheinyl transferase family protein n=1 Tax=Shimwellia pseudoproteus TaxID=570012 RepID=UPI0018EBA8B7|nr:4'-phosphopantetheinyl transferase superfamily protein [Shimwellia pseudoproteus]MBJ3814688.1 4'-phosphopantetheinyl transferase superfamily protein [Shimwellia pseudoproteus]
MCAFIQDVILSPHPYRPEARYCEVRFALSRWHDGLFSELGIHRPDHLHRAVPKRLAEYLAGRYACQHILRSWGIEADIPSGSAREPLWPPLVAGSLSHSGDRALALLIPARYRLSPGIDIETADRDTLLSIAPAIATPGEQGLLTGAGFSVVSGLLLLFSAKESLFKGLYPQVGRYFGCDAAQLCGLAPDKQQFTLQLTADLTDNLRAGMQYQGNFTFTPDGVITSLFCATHSVPASGQRGPASPLMPSIPHDGSLHYTVSKGKGEYQDVACHALTK